MFNTRAVDCKISRRDNPPTPHPLPVLGIILRLSLRKQTELLTGEWQRSLQLSEPRQLEGSDRDLVDAVPTQPQDLQGGTQVVQRSEL